MTDAAAIIAAELEHATQPCVTSSFQADCVVLLHLLRAVRPDIPVLFIDTAHHFAETLAYRDQLVAAWGLRLVNVRAEVPRVGLWGASTEACCAHHKVGPLFSALGAYDVWFTGLRRDQSPTRATLAEASSTRLPTGHAIRKVSPLASWSMHDVEAYAYLNEIPLLPLYQRGYTSIGCEPCTQPPLDPANPRSGRWLGLKLECGIHVAADPEA